MKLRGKSDANQTEIVEALRKLGCSVFVSSSTGKGFPDLVVGLEGKNFLLEVKTIGKSGRPAPKTSAQEKFCDGWRGQYYILTSRNEAIGFVKTVRSGAYSDINNRNRLSMT